MGLSRRDMSLLMSVYSAQEPLNVGGLTKKVRLGKSIGPNLNKLVDQGFILQKTVGNQKLNSFNFGNELAKKYAELFEAERLEDFLQGKHGLRKVLEKYRDSVYAACEGNLLAIILFGSYAQGTQTEASDLDLLTITADVEDKKFREIQDQVKEVERDVRSTHGQDISSMVARACDIREWKAQNQGLLEQIRRDRIVLFGERFFITEILEGK